MIVVEEVNGFVEVVDPKLDVIDALSGYLVVVAKTFPEAMRVMLLRLEYPRG